jgi:hypothetical protein
MQKEENCLNKAKSYVNKEENWNVKLEEKIPQCIWRFKWKFGGRSGNFFTQNLSVMSPPIPSFTGIRKVLKVFKSRYEMPKLSI